MLGSGRLAVLGSRPSGLLVGPRVPALTVPVHMSSAEENRAAHADEVDVPQCGEAAESGDSPSRRAVRDAQRSRILLGFAAAAREVGVSEVTVSEITARSGVSRRTFYEQFENVQATRLAAFEEGVRRASAVVAPAYEAPGSWEQRMRAALTELLRLIDSQPLLARFCMVDALGGGEVVLRRRAEVLSVAIDAVDLGRRRSRAPKTLGRFTAEGAVGAVCSILHTRLLADLPAPTLELRNQLMAILVQPYFGPAAASAELRRTPPSPGPVPAGEPEHDRLRRLGIRWTYRTLRTLEAIARHPGASSRQIGTVAGMVDQGQVSKLLSRLRRAELIENEGGPASRGEPNAWHLTELGEEAVAIVRDQFGR